jgi:hypothetical protein
MGRTSQETKLSKSIQDALKRLKFWCIRVQCGIVPLGRGRFMHLAENGTPDLWTSLGWLEVKDKSELSPAQIAWHEKAKEHNVRVAVVRSTQDAIDTVIKWKKEDEQNDTRKTSTD